MSLLPNVVIVGAPKSGTSSLFRWLADHPQVCASRVKEPHFFVERDHPMLNPACNVHDHGIEHYAGYFDWTLPEPPRVVLEGSTHYLYSDVAAEWLSGLASRPIAIAVLRNPTDRLYSSYRYTKHTLAALRPEVSFADYAALRSADQARRLTRPGWGGRVDVWARDVEHGRYADHLSRWRERLPEARLMVLVFEDLRQRPREVTRRVAEQVGLDPAFYDDYAFPRHNETYRAVSPGLHRVVRRLAGGGRGSFARKVLRGIYQRFLTASVERDVPEEDRAVLRQLDEGYAPDNARLGREFGVDVTAWRR